MGINNLQELNKSKEMIEQLEKYYLEKYNDEREKTQTSTEKIPQTKGTLEEKITLHLKEKNALQLKYNECLSELDNKIEQEIENIIIREQEINKLKNEYLYSMLTEKII